jgi:hypothetical protein
MTKSKKINIPDHRFILFLRKYRHEIFFVFLAFALYGNTIPNFYSLDDQLVILDNQKTHLGIRGIPAIISTHYFEEEGNTYGYRPVAQISFAIEYAAWGENPHMSHMVNVILYAIILVLLFSLLKRFLKGFNPLFPLLITILFAVHPIHTEVVASLKNRETLLSFVFCLVSLYNFTQFQAKRSILSLISGSLAFVLAYFSKQDAITFIAIIPLTLFFFTDKPVAPGTGLFKISNSIAAGAASVARNGFLLILAGIFYVLTMWIYRWGYPWALVPSYFMTLALLVIHFISKRNGKRITASSLLKNRYLITGMVLIVISVISNTFWPACLAIPVFSIFLIGPQANKNAATGATKFSEWKAPTGDALILLRTMSYIIFLLIILGFLVYKLPGLFLPDMKKELFRYENPLFGLDPAFDKTILVFQTLLFYLSKLTWPHPLGYYYGFNMIPATTWTNPAIVFSVIFHLGILLFALFKLSKKHILSYAILYYFITISVFTNWILIIPGIVAERLAFFPSLGFCIVFAWMILKVSGIEPARTDIPSRAKVRVLIAVLILSAVYGTAVILRNRDWKDDMTLFSHDIGYLENSAKANELFANRLIGKTLPAIISGKAGHQDSLMAAQARGLLRQIIFIDSTYKSAWNNLGLLYFNLDGNTAKAIGCLREAVKLDPGYAQAFYNLGHCLLISGQPDEAAVQFRMAISSDPDFIAPRLELAGLLFKTGDAKTAIRLNEEIIGMQPDLDTPYINIGDYLFSQKDTVRAVHYWELAFSKNPGNQGLCANLAGYFQHVKNNEKSVYYLMRLNPK